jgi:hypothetical protein
MAVLAQLQQQVLLIGMNQPMDECHKLPTSGK